MEALQHKLNQVEIGERIREIRKDLCLSREKFAEILDISDLFLGQIERGDRSLSLTTLDKIVSYSGSSTDYILYGNDENNGYVKKINRIIKNSSPETVELFYSLMQSIYNYNKKI